MRLPCFHRPITRTRPAINRCRLRLEELEPRLVLDTKSIAGFTFNGSLTPSSTSSNYSMYGSASISVSSESISIDLGTSTNPGLQVKNGTLTTLNATVTGSFSVASLTINADSLKLNYDSTSSDFSMTGGADFTLNGTTFSLSLPDTGLVIHNGSLKSISAAVCGSFTIGGFEFGADSLTFSYTAPTSGIGTSIAITGGAHFKYNDSEIKVTFGGDANSQGLVIQSGSLSTLDMAIDGELDVLGVKLTADGLTMDYVSSPEEFKFYGSVTVSSDDNSLDTITADLGTECEPGLVIDGTAVKSLTIGIDGSFQLFGLTIAPKDLHVNWDGAHTLNISGGVTVQLTNDISGGVSFPGGGLTIDTQSGAVNINGLDLSLDVSFGPFAIHNLSIDFSYVNNTIDVSASGWIEFPGGFGAQASLTITNGQLTDIGLEYEDSVGQPIGDTGLFLTEIGGSLHHLDNLSQLEVDASVRVNFGPTVNFDGTDYSLFEADGSISVTKDDLTLKGNINVLATQNSDGTWDGKLGQGSATIDLNWSKGVYAASVDVKLFSGIFNISGSFEFNNAGDFTLQCQADVKIPSNLLPSALSWIGDLHWPSAGFYLQVRPELPKDQSYAAAWVSLSGLGSVGLKYDFANHLTALDSAQISELGKDDASADREDAFGYYWYTTSVTVPANVNYADVTASSAAFVQNHGLSIVGMGPDEGFQVIEPNVKSLLFNINKGVSKSKQDPTYDSNPDDRQFVIGDPTSTTTLTPGTYLLRVRVAIPLDGLGSSYMPNFSVTYHYTPPTISISKVTVNGGSASISYSATNLAPDSTTPLTYHATIQFYYDTHPLSYYQQLKDTGYHGTYIGSVSFDRTSTSGTYKWTGLVQALDEPYTGQPVYIYGIITNSQNSPVNAAYSAQVVPPNPTPALTYPATIATHFQGPITFTGTNAVSIKDTAAEALGMKLDSLTVSVDSGSLQLKGRSASSFTYHNIPFANARTILGTLQFTPAAGTQGPVTITISAATTVGGQQFTQAGQIRLVTFNAALAVTQGADNTTPIEGGMVRVNVQVTNVAGPAALNASGVRLIESLPAGVQLLSATPSTGTFNPTSGIWKVGKLVIGASATLALTAKVDAGTAGRPLVLSAHASCKQPDFDPNNSTSALTLLVRQPIVVSALTDDTNSADYAASLRQQIDAQKMAIALAPARVRPELLSQLIQLEQQLTAHQTGLDEAVAIANSTPGPDVIQFAVTGSIAVPHTLNVTDDLVLDGPGAGKLTIRETSASTRTFSIGDHVNAALAGVTVAGGGIANHGNLTFENGALANNQWTGDGGAIDNEESLVVLRSDLASNRATRGGALFNNGHLKVEDSTFRDNSASGNGGALANLALSTATITNSTFHRNASNASGGAIDNEAMLQLFDDTLVDNEAHHGGALFSGKQTTVRGSIFALDHAGTGTDVSGSVMSQGYDLIGVTDGSKGWRSSDLQGTLRHPLDPQFGPLTNTGGETLTLVPRTGSPVIDAGDPTPAEKIDQRGESRVSGGKADIGAVEVQGREA
jgi:hypothetical protein